MNHTIIHLIAHGYIEACGLSFPREDQSSLGTDDHQKRTLRPKVATLTDEYLPPPPVHPDVRQTLSSNTDCSLC